MYQPLQEFREIVWEYYRQNHRELPWREEPFDAYQILVSEIMLQQTQAPRVIPKYQSFLRRFPSIQALAKAPLSDVLREWSGLGYNRRAKYLHEATKQLATKDQPWSLEDLEACKGVGPNTAAAVMVYSYNQPLVFIETNIRTVFIHHFFNDKEGVSDKELLPFIEESLDMEHPRAWYYALMDYGTHLKKTVGNASRQSKHYAKQSRFEGSKRQIRGMVLRELAVHELPQETLHTIIPDDRLEGVLTDLIAEGLIFCRDGTYQLA